jgi:hypothetical protein
MSLKGYQDIMMMMVVVAQDPSISEASKMSEEIIQILHALLQ